MEKLKDWWCYHYRHIYLIGGCILIVIILIGLGIWKLDFSEQDYISKGDDSLVIEKQEEKEKNNEIFVETIDTVVVDIKGAVNSPGIYYVDSNSRVSDVISAAGGVLDYADTSVINLSRKVFDEMVIIIYTKDEVNNFIKVKEEEKEKQEACIIVEEKIINDACVCKDDVDNSNLNSNSNITSSNNTNDINKDSADNNSSGKIELININQASLEELMTLSGIGESKAKLIIEYRDTNNGFKDINELKNIKGIGNSIFEKIKDNITV